MIRSTALYVIKRIAWLVVITLGALLFAYFSPSDADAAGGPGRIPPSSAPATHCDPDEEPDSGSDPCPTPSPAPTPTPTPTPTPEPSSLCVPACEVALVAEDRARLDLISGQGAASALLVLFFLGGILVVTGLRR